MDGLRHVHAGFALWPGEAVDGVRRCVLDPQLERDTFGPRARRIGPVSRMAAVAAAGCLARTSLRVEPERLAVFQGSAMGNIHEMVTTFTQSLGDRGATPSPTTFANSVGNIILFHAGRATGARGPALLLTQEETAFEEALAAALDHGPPHGVDAALVGGVDGFAGPAGAHAVRVGAPAGAELGEGAACLLLAAEPRGSSGTVLGVLRASADAGDVGDVGDVGDDALLDDLAAQVAELRAAGDALVVHPGLRVDADDLAALSARLGPLEPAPYLERSGWFPTAAALALAAALEQPARLHLHVVRDVFGTLTAVLLRTH